MPAAIATEEKKHDKDVETTTTTTPTEKKTKRSSVFGSLFGKKGVTSPTVEKSEKDVGPSVPVKDNHIPAVTENAPKLEEPAQSKPVDMAAPVSTALTPAATHGQSATATEPAPVLAGEPIVTPRTEKKGFMSFMPKKQKDETREEVAADKTNQYPIVIPSTDGTTEAPIETTPAVVAKEERPTQEKRRTSLFGSLGTMKRKQSPAVAEGEDMVTADRKREKSPLPAKLGALFRKPSKAVRSEAPKQSTDVSENTESTTKAGDETPVVGGAIPSATAPVGTDSSVAGDHATTFHDAVTTAPADVKISA